MTFLPEQKAILAKSKASDALPIWLLEKRGISQLYPDALLRTLDVSHKEVVAYDYGSRQLGCDSGEVVIGHLLELVHQLSDGI